MRDNNRNMWNVSLEQGAGFATLLAVAAVAIALSAGFYYRAFGMLRPGAWQLLLLLRAVAIVLIVLLLFRPVMSYYKEQEKRRSVVLLLDRSASMSIADSATRMTRFQQARQQIDTWREKLQDDFDLYLIAFAERPQVLDDPRRELPALAPDGKATSLSAALVAATKLRDRHNQPVEPEAVILLSDGVHNSARDPTEVAQRMSRVVHTVGVGASLKSDVSYRDVQVTGMDCPERLLLNNKAQITASIEGVGLAGRVVQVVFEEDEQPLGEPLELTLDQVEGSQKVTFEFRPTSKGRHTYTVRVPPATEERIEQNNQRTTVSMVVEPGIRVLYLEGTIRAEYGALVQRFLSKDPDLEFCALAQTRPNVFTMRSNIPDLQLNEIPTDADTMGQFDVFMIGDLDASYLRGPQQELIVDRVRRGAGVVMLGGYHSLGPGGYAGTALGEVLPLRLGNRQIGQLTEAFLPVLTPEGRRHPIFANIADFFPSRQGGAHIEGLPLLAGCTRVEGPQPGAAVLAEFLLPPGELSDGSLRGQAGAMAVLAVQPVGEGRAAVFCGDTTRRWQQGPRAMNQESPFLRFWGQTVRWLAGRDTALETGGSITASTDKACYEPEEPIEISAVVRDEQGEGARDVRVLANITEPGGRVDQAELSTVPGPAGHYAVTYEPKASGELKIEVQTQLGEKKLAAETIVVEVGRPHLEFEKLDLNEELLTRIAAETGGRYVHITTADYLVEQLDRSLRKRREYREIRLYWPPLFWVLFVSVLTTEWILRKRFQLR